VETFKLNPLRAALIGDDGVGKSSLQTFSQKALETIREKFLLVRGFDVMPDIYAAKFSRNEAVVVKECIVSFKSHIILLVFSIGSRKSFERLSVWFKAIESEKKDMRVLLVGSMSDLRNSPSVNPTDLVQQQEAQLLAKQWGCCYREYNINEMKGIADIFETAYSIVAEMYDVHYQPFMDFALSHDRISWIKSLPEDAALSEYNLIISSQKETNSSKGLAYLELGKFFTKK